LEGAAENGRLDTITLLWNAVSSKRFVDDVKQCNRAMKLAKENGHIACRELIQQLLEADQKIQGIMPLPDFDDWFPAL